MKPVEQTITGYPNGNCLGACIASILELEIGELPTICAADADSYEQWQAWLGTRGWALFFAEVPPAGYAIATTHSPRLAGKFHAVVALDGAVVWDPHPARAEGPGALQGTFEILVRRAPCPRA